MRHVDWVGRFADVVAVTVFGVFSAGLLLGVLWVIWLVARREVCPFSVISSRVDETAAPATASVPRQFRRISLSKLQMLLWTVVLVFAWLYKLVKNPGEFPELPAQALLLMGISGAAYLGAKQQGLQAARLRREGARGDAA
jgi:hypothetical protein